MSQDSSPRTTNPYAAPGGKGELDEGVASLERRLPWTTLIGLGIFQGVTFGVLWSLGMSLGMRQGFFQILFGPGLFAGVSFGIFIAVYFAIAMRPTAVTFPFQDRAAFLAELESKLGKLRYRMVEGDGNRLVFSPRTPIRPKEFFIIVELRPDSALVVGPRANLNALKKHLDRA